MLPRTFALTTTLLLQACLSSAQIDTTIEARNSATEGAPQKYNRKGWHHWIDADHDCQDTRNEVLIAESEIPVEFKDRKHCDVARGRWTCPYTGETVTDPALLDIDHMVPLENANRSGGKRWSSEEKEAYANDLEEPEHLIAVTKSANRSKGAKGPEEWLPTNIAFACEYASDWRAVKTRWKLAMTPVEAQAVARILEGCP